MNKTTLGFSIISSALLLTTTATADRPKNILLATASQYENAVRNLDRVVSRSREIRGGDRNIVNRLELAAKRMTQAARNPRHVNRLRFERRKVLPLQQQVESALFENYSPNLELVRAWEYVLCAQFVFDQELAYFVEDPRRGNSIQRRIQSPAPSRILTLPAGYELAPAAFPNMLPPATIP